MERRRPRAGNKKKFYAVASGSRIGIFTKRRDTDHPYFGGTKAKRFRTRVEAEAFLRTHTDASKKHADPAELRRGFYARRQPNGAERRERHAAYIAAQRAYARRRIERVERVVGDWPDEPRAAAAVVQGLPIVQGVPEQPFYQLNQAARQALTRLMRQMPTRVHCPDLLECLVNHFDPSAYATVTWEQAFGGLRGCVPPIDINMSMYNNRSNPCFADRELQIVTDEAALKRERRSTARALARCTRDNVKRQLCRTPRNQQASIGRRTGGRPRSNFNTSSKCGKRN